MRRSCITDPFVRLLSFVSLICGGIALVIISGSEVLARVGGGQSYGGGGGHDGGGGGGAIIWLVFQLIRFLLYLTFDYPLVGIPLDILVIGSVVYYFARPRKGGPESFSSAAA